MIYTRPFFYVLTFAICTIAFRSIAYASSCESDQSIAEQQISQNNATDFYEKLISNGLNETVTPISSDHLNCFTSLIETDSSDTNKAIFVDTRDHIKSKNPVAQNAIAIPISLLPSKSFLKNKDVVLIHNSQDYYSLLDACSKLKNSGFKDVSILIGGINRWDSVLHKTTIRSKLSLISPQELYALDLNGMWLVLTITDTDTPIKADNLIPIRTKDIANLQSVLDNSVLQYSKKHSHSPNILIVSQNGNDYTTVLKTLKIPDALNAFYLEDGVSGFDQFSKTHAILMDKRIRSEQNTTSCGK